MTHTSQVTVRHPTEISAIELSPSSEQAIREMCQDFSAGLPSEMKVVLGIHDGRAVLAIGPVEMYHVHILGDATADLGFSRNIVTSPDPDTTRPIAGALVQGARFTITSLTPPAISVYRPSDSFGDFGGSLFGREIREVVSDVICSRIALHALVAVNLKIPSRE